MEQAVLEGAETVAHELEGRLTKEQVVALAAHEKMLFGDGGDVAFVLRIYNHGSIANQLRIAISALRSCLLIWRGVG